MRKAHLLVVAGLGLISSHLFGQTVFLLPGATQGTSNVTAYTISPFSAVGTFAATPSAFEVLSRADGGEYYVISNSTSNTVVTTTASLSNVQSLIGFGTGATTAIRSPDGQKILVAAGALEVVRTADDAVLPAITVGGTAIDLAASIDSTQVYVLVNTGSGYQLADVNLAQSTVVKTLAIPGIASAVTAGPNGLIYVGTTNALLEVDPTSLLVLNTIPASGTPGKLSFTPNGRYGLAPNLNNSTGVALFVFDLVQKSVAPPFTTAVVPNQLSQVFVVSDTLAYGFSASTATLYTLQISGQTATVFQFAPAGTVSLAGITNDLGTTNAIPAGNHAATKYLLFVSSGVLYEYDIANNAVVQQSSLAITPGALSIATPANTSGFPSSVFAYGDQQTVPVGQTSAPLVIRAVDQNGNPVPGVGINFSSSSGATISNASSLTNDDGLASTRITYNTTGQIQVSAAAGNVLGYTFTVNYGTSGGGGGGGGGGGTGTPAGLAIVNGQGTLLPAGVAVSADTTDGTMKVQYTDTSGNPIVGATITFTQATGNGVLVAVCGTSGLCTQSQTSITVTTDSNGIAASDYQAAGVDPTNSADFTQAIITATAPNGSAQTFYVSSFNIGATPTIRLLAPDPGTMFSGRSGSTIAAAIQASITSFSGASIPNVSIRIANPPNPAKSPSAQCAGGFPISDSTGTATCNLVLSGLAGSAQVTPEVGYFGDFLPFVINVSASVPAKANIVSGNNQTAKAGQTLPAPFVVQIVDSSGNPLPQVPVSWKTVSGTITLSQVSSATDANGKASALGTLGSTAGQAVVQVTAGTGSSQVSANFTANITVPVTIAGVSLVSGNSQTANENAGFGSSLVVAVTDTNGNPVAGQAVTFAVTSGSATIATPTATTGSNGQASTTVTAGPTPGAVVVTASSNGFSVTFNLTVIAPGPSNVVFLNGASFQPGASAGAIVTIQGTNITPGITGVVVADNIVGPLPTSLAGISVAFNGTLAPIFSVSNVNNVQQITVQVPFEVAGLTTASVVINTPGGGMGTFTVNLSAYSPGVFTTSVFGTNNQTVAIRPDGSYVSPSNPAHRGENIVVFVTGLGQTSPALGTGNAGVPNQNVLATLAVGFNNAGAPFVSAQTVVGLVGVYAITVQVPANTTAGPSQPFGLIAYDASGNAIFGNSSSLPIQ